MAQLLNPYNSNGKLGGKGKKKAPHLLGVAPARKGNYSYMVLKLSLLRGRR
jgi:hypothetical protein